MPPLPFEAPSMDEARLRFLLRRGMRELDVLMVRYHAHRYTEAPQAERETFVRLVTEVEDPDIWAWAMGFQPTPAEFVDVIEQLRRHR
jgi:antitoxin CptB